MTKTRSAKPARASAVQRIRKPRTTKPPVVETKPATDDGQAAAKKAQRDTAIAAEVARLTAGIPPLTTPDGRALLFKRIQAESDHLQGVYDDLPREERRRLYLHTPLSTVRSEAYCLQKDEPPLKVGGWPYTVIETWDDLATALAGMIVDTRKAFGCEPLPIVVEAAAPPVTPRGYPPVRIHETTDSQRRESLRKGTVALEVLIANEEWRLAALRDLLVVARSAENGLTEAAAAKSSRGLDVLYDDYCTAALTDEMEKNARLADEAEIALGVVFGRRIYMTGGSVSDTPWPERVEYLTKEIEEHGLAKGSALLRPLGSAA